MPFFTSFFSSSNAASSSHTKNSHLKRFINNVTKPSQYVPDIYDDLRDDGFYFRPSDTYTSTALSSSIEQTNTQAQASKSTPNLHKKVPTPAADGLFELADLPVPRRPVTGYRHSNEVSRESATSFASFSSAASNETAATSTEVHELATLPASIYASPPPRRSFLAAARQHALGKLSGEHAASMPCLPFELNAEGKHTRGPATVKVQVQYRSSVGESFVKHAHTHAHAPARPSPLKLATIAARRPSEDVPIMLSPRTAAYEKALPLLPLASCPITPDSGAAFRRKPVPSTPSATPVVSPEIGDEVQLVELPSAVQLEDALELSELDSGHELMILPGLPSRLSRLETLRYRLSLVDPPPSSFTTALPLATSSTLTTALKRDINTPELTRNFSLRTYHSALSLADVNRMSAFGAVARGKRGHSTGSDGSVNAEADNVAAEGELEHEEAEIDNAIEIGTAKVVGGISGVVGRAKMVGFKGRVGESVYEVDMQIAGRVVKGAKGGNKRKSMGRERQRDRGVVGWWHTRGE